MLTPNSIQPARKSPTEIIFERLRPIPLELAEAFVRAPLATIVVAMFAFAMPIASAKGITGAFGAPFVIALPLGILGVAFQADSYVRYRQKRGSRASNFLVLALVSLCNLISVTAGIVALSPDSQGQAMIARALDPVIGAVQQRTTALDMAAVRYDELARYSVRRAVVEGAEASTWQPTCPGSQGPGSGPIQQWRIETGQQATALAAELRQAAQSSRAAATTATRAAASYTFTTHDKTMDVIAAAVATINQSGAVLRGDSASGFLQRLSNETAGDGICPDAPMQTLILAASNAAKANSPAPLEFSPPPKPSEEISVRDLTRQLVAPLFGEPQDLSLYQRYLWIAPLADLLFMFFLGRVLPPVYRDFRGEAASRLGVEPESALYIDTVAAEIAHAAEWRSIVTKRVQVRLGWFGFDRILVAEDDWLQLYRMREYVASGGMRERGPDSAGHIVFNLRPHFLSELWQQLLRRGLKDRELTKPETITIVRGG